MGKGGRMEEDGIRNSLERIEKQLDLQLKILTDLVESVDAKRHEQAAMRKSAADLIRQAGAGIPNSPLASVLKSTANTMEGKHGD